MKINNFFKKNIADLLARFMSIGGPNERRYGGSWYIKKSQLEAPPSTNFFLKNGQSSASFTFIFVFSNKHYRSYNKYT